MATAAGPSTSPPVIYPDCYSKLIIEKVSEPNQYVVLLRGDELLTMTKRVVVKNANANARNVQNKPFYIGYVTTKFSTDTKVTEQLETTLPAEKEPFLLFKMKNGQDPNEQDEVVLSDSILNMNAGNTQIPVVAETISKIMMVAQRFYLNSFLKMGLKADEAQGKQHLKPVICAITRVLREIALTNNKELIRLSNGLQIAIATRLPRIQLGVDDLGNKYALDIIHQNALEKDQELKCIFPPPTYASSSGDVKQTMAQFANMLYPGYDHKYYCVVKQVSGEKRGRCNSSVVAKMTLIPFIERGFIELYDLEVSKDLQGMRIGSTLLTQAISLMHQNINLYNAIWLGVLFSNPNYDKVVSFYLNNGFRIIGPANSTLGGTILSETVFKYDPSGHWVLAMAYSPYTIDNTECPNDQLALANSYRTSFYTQYLSNYVPPRNTIIQGEAPSIEMRQASVNAASGQSMSKVTNASAGSAKTVKNENGYKWRNVNIPRNLWESIYQIVKEKPTEHGAGVTRIDKQWVLTNLEQGGPSSVQFTEMGLINLHTHNLSCYTEFSCHLGWPSGADFKMCIENADKQRLHLVFAVEGVYSIQLTTDFFEFIPKICTLVIRQAVITTIDYTGRTR